MEKVGIKFYDIAVVIVTYNVVEYIEEAINSIINQSLKNIQVIVVDDGSTDGTKNVVEQLATNNENIYYQFSENSGSPSRPRNIGIRMANAKYITFLDGDDYLDENACEMLFNIAEKENSDIVAANMMSFIGNRFFETFTRNPNYSERAAYFKSINHYDVTHITENPVLYQMPNCCAKLYLTDLIKDITFDESIKYGEDHLFSIETFFKSKKTVVLDKFVYFYRGRTNSTTRERSLKIVQDAYESVYAIDNVIKKYESNINDLDDFYQKIAIYRMKIGKTFIEQLRLFPDAEKKRVIELLNESYFRNLCIENYSKLNLFNFILIDLAIQNKFDEAIAFSNLIEEIKRYKSAVSKKDISISNENDQIIFSFYYNEKNVSVDITECFEHIPLVTHLTNFSFENFTLKLDGIGFFQNINLSSDKDISHQLVLVNRNTKNRFIIEAERKYTNRYNTAISDYHNGGFSFSINLLEINDLGRYDLFLETTCFGKVKTRKITGPTRTFKLKCRNYYFEMNHKNYELILAPKNLFAFRLNSGSKLKLGISKVKHNIRKKLSTIKEIKNNRGIDKGKKIRLSIATLCKELSRPFFKGRKVILVGEKLGDTFNDNGAAYFRYCRQNHPNEDVYYLIKKSSKDYEEVKKLGNAIPFYSLKHLFYSMNAKYIVSTDNVNMLLPSNIRPLRNAKRIFVGHGVTLFKKVDHVYHARIDVADSIACASELEKEIFMNHFGFNEDQLFITGLPRTQILNNNVMGKNILLTFTWRPSIGNRNEFLSSEYYQRLKSLFNNQKLLNALMENNVTLTILLHPRMVEYVDLLEAEHPNIILKKFTEINVKDYIESSSMIITDYSSILFDFIFLKKPIVMYGFDYFIGDYAVNEKDINEMLPEVFYQNEEEVVESIVSSIKSNFKIASELEHKYGKLINTHQESCNYLHNHLQ